MQKGFKVTMYSDIFELVYKTFMPNSIKGFGQIQKNTANF